MEDVIDIIVKKDKALVILSRKERSVMDNIKNQIEKEFNVRKMEFLHPDLMFKERDLMKDFFDGFSVINNMNLFEEFGLNKFVRYSYGLEKLDTVKKVKFSHDLIGRRNQPGILQRSDGLYLGKGVFAIPEGFTKPIEKMFRSWGINFEKEIFYR